MQRQEERRAPLCMWPNAGAGRQQNMMTALGFQKHKTTAATMRRSPPPGPSQAWSLPALAVIHSELGESTWY